MLVSSSDLGHSVLRRWPSPTEPEGLLHPMGERGALREAAGLFIEHSRLPLILPPAPVYLICVQLRSDGPKPQAMGSSLDFTGERDGDVQIFDLASEPAHPLGASREWVQFRLPKRSLDQIVAEHDWPVVRTLACGYGTFDPVLLRLAKLALPWAAQSKPELETWIEHFRFILCTHLAKTYGCSDGAGEMFSGGLASWQRRRCVEVMRSKLGGGLELASLAQACGLSLSHFARSFKQSFGLPAHQYLIRLRVDAAKEMLLTRESALADIALECGFCDQAAFSRTFSSVVGSSPGRWRRAIRAQAQSAIQSVTS
jgi:AraC-like DNA-binding protein